MFQVIPFQVQKTIVSTKIKPLAASGFPKLFSR